MQKELGTVLKSRLIELPFIDVLAGVAQTVTSTDTVGNAEDVQTTTVKRYPVSDDNNQDPGIFGKETLLIPNEGRRSIIYFEDYGIQVIDYNGWPGYQSSIRVIAWLNRELLTGDTYAMISGRVMAAMIDKLLTRNPINVSIFSKLIINIARIPPQDPALFGRYNYNETQRQYLRPPFEYFGIDLNSKYMVNPACLTGITWV